jgi:ATP-binding cassette, subfamily A (ABC1), member 3
MEEATALSNKVGILSKRMLGTYTSCCCDAVLTVVPAIGTPDALISRYAAYEVHFSSPTRTRDDLIMAQRIMSNVPGAKAAEDVTARFEVPVTQFGRANQQHADALSIGELFRVLANQVGKQDGDSDEAGSRSTMQFTVQKGRLESVFGKVIRENMASENEKKV